MTDRHARPPTREESRRRVERGNTRPEWLLGERVSIPCHKLIRLAGITIFREQFHFSVIRESKFDERAQKVSSESIIKLTCRFLYR